MLDRAAAALGGGGVRPRDDITLLVLDTVATDTGGRLRRGSPRSEVSRGGGGGGGGVLPGNVF